MLKILRRIVQEMNDAKNLEDSLQILVKQVREVLETQAATVFLIDREQGKYVLMATDGLNPDIVKRISIPLEKGLVGQVIQREELINLENAPENPHFVHVPEVREEPFKAFLGVPIIHQRRVLGVIVVQQEDARCFDESEEAFMVTLSAQLAGVIAHAEATGAMLKLSSVEGSASQDRFEGASLGGIPGAPGVGIGEAVVVYPLADLDAVPDRKAESVVSELAQFDMALSQARDEIQALKGRMEGAIAKEEQALFDVYLRILDKMGIGDEVAQEIRDGQWAQGALRTVIKRHALQFEAMEDDYLRERAVDVRDLGRRVLSHLQARQKVTIQYPEKTILIGDEVTASALASVPEGRLMGLVSAQGSGNSHVAILARAMGVPTVMGVDDLPVSHLEGRELIVDGYYGQMYVSPSSELREEFLLLAEEERQLDADLQSLRNLPAETPDGHKVSLYVNTGLAADAGLSLSVGAEGVGLYRTEVPFMIRDCFPAEGEQTKIYKQMLAAFSPRPVVMRTLDVGGDKPLPYFPVEEDNPFLGWRGIRLTLDHPEVFLVQLRAMLKASEGFGNLRIMFPMVSGIGEIDEAQRLLNQAFQEVTEEGFEIQKPTVGVMIEIPSSVYQADEFAKRVDFLSVGSNDLTQYLLAVDRNNARVATLYDSLHPAVIQALHDVVKSAHAQQTPISICGEMASDPAAVILLVALGFDALSMSAASLPRVKWVVRNFTVEQARTLLAEVREMNHPTMIRCHLELALEQAGLGGLIRAGK